MADAAILHHTGIRIANMTTSMQVLVPSTDTPILLATRERESTSNKI